LVTRIVEHESLEVGKVSPLYYAASFNLTNICERLVSENGIEDLTAFHPIIAASGAGNERVVSLLLKSGVNPNCKEPRHHGASLGEFDDEELREAFSVLNKLFLGKTGSDCGRNALTAAVRGRHIAIVKMLIAHGAEVDAPDDLGLAALYYAAESGQTETVKVLLEAGAKVDRYYIILGATALTAAMGNQHFETARVLIERSTFNDPASTKTFAERFTDHLPEPDSHILESHIRTVRSMEDKEQVAMNGYKLAGREALFAVMQTLFDRLPKLIEDGDSEGLNAIRKVATTQGYELERIVFGRVGRFLPIVGKMRWTTRGRLSKAFANVTQESMQEFFDFLLLDSGAVRRWSYDD
jgi:hypothetical protein